MGNNIVKSTRIIKKQGALEITLSKAALSLNIDSVNAGPRFLGYGTGGYWGLTGFYSSIPCWRNDGYSYKTYQASLFNIPSVGGIFYNDMLLDDPFIYHAKLDPAMNGRLVGMLDCPNSSIFTGAYQGALGVYCDNAKDYTGFAPLNGYMHVSQMLQSPPIYFDNRKVGFNAATSQKIVGDYFGTGFRVLRQSASPFAIFGATFAETPISFNDATDVNLRWAAINWNYAFQKGEVITVIVNSLYNTVLGLGGNTSGDVTPAVVNPKNGNYLIWENRMTSGAKWKCGSVIGTYDPLFQLFSDFIVYDIVLSDPVDNAELIARGGGSNFFSCIQAAGGNFLLFEQKPSTSNTINAYFISADLSSYVQYTIYYPSQMGTGATINPYTLGIDFNGVLYAIGHSSLTATGDLFWSYGSPKTAILQVPPLTQIGVACQSPACNPW